MIYFIRSGKYIKIGVSNNPWKRIATLQTANPEPLEMVAIAPGDYGFESELRGLFNEYHHNGEWFADNEQIMTFANLMRKMFPYLQTSGSIPKFAPEDTLERIQPNAPLERYLELVARERRAGKLPTISTNSLHDLGISRYGGDYAPAKRAVNYLEETGAIQDMGERRPYEWTELGESQFPGPPYPEDW